jgi:hypothetical protein
MPGDCLLLPLISLLRRPGTPPPGAPLAPCSSSRCSSTSDAKVIGRSSSSRSSGDQVVGSPSSSFRCSYCSGDQVPNPPPLPPLPPIAPPACAVFTWYPALPTPPARPVPGTRCPTLRTRPAPSAPSDMVTWRYIFETYKITFLV